MTPTGKNSGKNKCWKKEFGGGEKSYLFLID